ncbi:hypothetical protein [Rhodococcus sp. NPDC003348]
MTTHGGARNRSGPHADPLSGRSDTRNLKARQLDVHGYQGAIPTFPLADPTDREVEVWEQAWRTPQASQWIRESWRWRTIALWTRWSVKMEAPDAPAATAAAAVRLADQIGLTPAGLRENGWVIVPEDLVDDPASSDTPRAQSAKRKNVRKSSSGRRLSSVPDAD